MSPAVSQSQQSAAALALSAKRGKIPVSRLKGAALSMYKSMTKTQLEEYAGTKTKRLPVHKSEKITEGRHRGKFRIIRR